MTMSLLLVTMARGCLLLGNLQEWLDLLISYMDWDNVCMIHCSSLPLSWFGLVGEICLFLILENISGHLSMGYSTPFVSLGASYMYPSLAAAKAAVISVGEEIATMGLPSGICPLVFVFTGSGNGTV